MNSIRVISDDRPEAVIRRSLWRWWTILVALLAWFTWSIPLMNNQSPNWWRIWMPTVASVAGYGIGWLFGYKLGIGPLFTGVYLFQKKDEG